MFFTGFRVREMAIKGILAILLSAAWAAPLSAQSTVSCGCYCGVMVPPPCTDDACKKACGYSGSGKAERLREDFDEEAAGKRREDAASRQAEEERLSKEKFESRRRKALGALKDAGAPEFKLKGAESGFKLKGGRAEEECRTGEDLQAYHEREQKRRGVLKELGRGGAGGAVKARIDWCKLNIPLPPSPSASGYCEKKRAYEVRNHDWEVKCAWASAGGGRPDGKRGRAGAAPAKPSAAADCLGVYDAEAGSCARNEPGCVNNAIQVYLRCVGSGGTAGRSLEGTDGSN